MSKFRIGDRVQLTVGGGFMLVTEIISLPKMKEPLLQCKWYDPETHTTKTNLFAESKIQFFDQRSVRKPRLRYTISELATF